MDQNLEALTRQTQEPLTEIQEKMDQKNIRRKYKNHSKEYRRMWVNK